MELETDVEITVVAGQPPRVQVTAEEEAEAAAEAAGEAAGEGAAEVASDDAESSEG